MRILSPYEKNQLKKYNISEDKLLISEIPVEYLTGFVEFCGLDLAVNRNVLIPRVETEEFVKIAIKSAKEIYSLNKTTLNILDVGTGSGAIAICVATKLKDLKIPFKMIGVDISSKALNVAQMNLEKNDATLPITFSRSDLLTNLESNNKFDLILANLPYIPSTRLHILDESVKDFEPHIALDGGPDGLNLVRKLLGQAESRLSETGIVVLELDLTHDEKVSFEFSNHWNIKLSKDFSEGIYFWVLKLIATI